MNIRNFTGAPITFAGQTFISENGDIPGPTLGTMIFLTAEQVLDLPTDVAREDISVHLTHPIAPLIDAGFVLHDPRDILLGKGELKVMVDPRQATLIAAVSRQAETRPLSRHYKTTSVTREHHNG